MSLAWWVPWFLATLAAISLASVAYLLWEAVRARPVDEHGRPYERGDQ